MGYNFFYRTSVYPNNENETEMIKRRMKFLFSASCQLIQPLHLIEFYANMSGPIPYLMFHIEVDHP